MDKTNRNIFISSKSNSNWIIEKHINYVEIKSISNQYLYYDEEANEIIVSENQRTRWGLTDMGGLKFFIQPCNDKKLYLSIFGSEIKLLQYNPDLMQTIFQKWVLNGW